MRATPPPTPRTGPAGTDAGLHEAAAGLSTLAGACLLALEPACRPGPVGSGHRGARPRLRPGDGPDRPRAAVAIVREVVGDVRVCAAWALCEAVNA